VKATIKQGCSIDPVSYHLNLPAEIPHQNPIYHPDHHHMDHPDHQQIKHHHIDHPDLHQIDHPDQHQTELSHPPTITT
jgi:hypothetical protein